MEPDDYYDEEETTDEELAQMTETKNDPAIPTDGIELKIQNYALKAIADAAAYRISETLSETVAEMVREKVDAILDDAWKASIAEQARAAIDAYLNAPRAKTNEWGESVNGKSTTLSSMIPKTVTDWLQQRVDDQGRPSDYSRSTSRMDWMLKNMVTDKLKEETEKAASSVTEKARALVSQHVGRFISEQMVPAISVDGGRA